MDQGTDRKPFKAELQRLRQQISASPGGRGGPSNADILSAIEELRDDLRRVEEMVRPEGAEPAPSPAPGANQEAEALAQELAEVDILKTELRALSLAIQHTKLEIAALRPKDADDDRLITVTFELDAIVNATERATQDILDSAEKIDNLSGSVASHTEDNFLKAQADEIREHIITIFEACNFQDITGQRITKVVNTLKFIENRINAMIDIWGAESFHELPRSAAREPEKDEEAKLLNGPQLESKAISQAEIDALFD